MPVQGERDGEKKAAEIVCVFVFVRMRQRRKKICSGKEYKEACFHDEEK